MTIDSAISMAGLTKHYPGVAALTDLSLEVPAGSIYGFLGPNGAGKSTTIKVLAGLTRPTRGSASVAGIPIVAGPGYRREVGYLAQEPQFYDWMTGRETLRFVASLYPAADRAGRRPRHGRPRSRRPRRCRRSADRPPTRAGCASGWGSPRRSSARRPSCSSTSPSAPSTRSVAARSSTSCASCGERSPSSTPPTSSTTSNASAITSRSSTAVGSSDPPRPPSSSSSFDQDQLRVVIGGADDGTAVAIASIPGVISVEPAERSADLRSYLVRVAPGAGATVQAAITRFAAEHGQIVTENHLVRLGLEDVFLRLVNTKERAA